MSEKRVDGDKAAETCPGGHGVDDSISAGDGMEATVSVSDGQGNAGDTSRTHSANLPEGQTEAAEFPRWLTDKGFTVVKFIASGGMGSVYLAHQISLARDVAIKVTKLPNKQASRRFQREARTVAGFDLANIVPVYDILDQQDQLAIVMAACPGDLRSLINSAKLSLGEAIELIIAVAKAMAVVHNKGIVHRDIKPGNILIAADGRPLLADFGLAKGSGEMKDASLTQSGQLVGSPQYLSPEGSYGKEQLATADIYSLGATLFTTLTGSPPLIGDNAMEVLRQIDTQALSVRIQQFIRRCPWIPGRLRTEFIRILRKSTARNAEERYQSMGEFAAELEALKAKLRTDEKNASIVPYHISDQELTSVLSLSIDSIMDFVRVPWKRWIAVCCVVLIIGLWQWFSWNEKQVQHSDTVPRSTETTEVVSVLPEKITQAAAEAPKPQKLIFDEDSTVARRQLILLVSETLGQSFNKEDIEFIADTENLRLRFVGYDADKVSEILEKLAGSEGKVPWQEADIMLSPAQERSTAFIHWARAHSVYVYSP